MRVIGLTVIISWCDFLFLSVVLCGVLTFWSFPGNGCRFGMSAIRYPELAWCSGGGRGGVGVRETEKLRNNDLEPIT